MSVFLYPTAKGCNVGVYLIPLAVTVAQITGWILTNEMSLDSSELRN